MSTHRQEIDYFAAGCRLGQAEAPVTAGDAVGQLPRLE